MCLILQAQGFTYEEIAEKMGHHVKSVDNALQRAQEKLTIANRRHNGYLGNLALYRTKRKEENESSREIPTMRFSLEYVEQVPYDILNDSVRRQASPEEITARIARYVVMDVMKLPLNERMKISIARNKFHSTDFAIAVVQKLAHKRRFKTKVTIDDIKTTANQLGLFEDIWPEHEELAA